MFGINKNGTKHKIGIIMPASYPASRVSYNGGTVEDALGIPTGSLTVSGMWSTVQASGNYVATIPLLHADDYTISTGSCATFSGGGAIVTSVTIAEKRTYGLVLTSPTSSIGGCFFELVLNISQ